MCVCGYVWVCMCMQFCIRLTLQPALTIVSAMRINTRLSVLQTDSYRFSSEMTCTGISSHQGQDTADASRLRNVWAALICTLSHQDDNDSYLQKAVTLSARDAPYGLLSAETYN